MLGINRYLVIVGAGLFILIVFSLVLALTTEVSTLEEGTPERSVQLFLEHLKNDRFSEAHSFLTLDKQKTCNAVHFLRQFSDYGDSQLQDSNISLNKPNQEIAQATIVNLEISRIEPSPFGSSENSYQESFTLILEDNIWKISEFNFPMHCFKEALN